MTLQRLTIDERETFMVTFNGYGEDVRVKADDIVEAIIEACKQTGRERVDVLRAEEI